MLASMLSGDINLVGITLLQAFRMVLELPLPLAFGSYVTTSGQSQVKFVVVC